MDTSEGCITHRVCDNIGEERRFLIEAAEDQLTDRKGEVEVERSESQLVVDFALKCKIKTQRDEMIANMKLKERSCEAVLGQTSALS